MITLLPALLVIFGRWIFWPVRPGFGSSEPTSRGFWSRVGQAIGRRPRTVWMVTAILPAAYAAGMIGFARHADHGPVVPRNPAVHRRAERAARYFPAVLRRAHR
jgi:RND superfamily putative drug exporter